ncbi:hypothetical protein Nepgr_011222 [Nepenthes gracilis]|uniref:Uncharacterized protein n=1 Tax=Nepenthes gracilis TaxID=150966 RepID=A0AAD3SES7_NEPGR|nr:hypothetical protein Nepgr_011222 [Nepenthes gracilis]
MPSTTPTPPTRTLRHASFGSDHVLPQPPVHVRSSLACVVAATAVHKHNFITGYSQPKLTRKAARADHGKFLAHHPIQTALYEAGQSDGPSNGPDFTSSVVHPTVQTASVGYVLAIHQPSDLLISLKRSPTDGADFRQFDTEAGGCGNF